LTSPLERLLRFVVTCGYIGYLPAAPGTYASLLGIILLWLFPALFTNLIFVVALVVFSVASINCLRLKEKDPGFVVIDELAGICVTMVGNKPSLVNLAAGFLLFRFFDILKPFPVRNTESLKNGYGIVADDVVAGLYANVMLWGGHMLYDALKAV
jgi:phosphatidylglycerophosphatase A